MNFYRQEDKTNEHEEHAKYPQDPAHGKKESRSGIDNELAFLRQQVAYQSNVIEHQQRSLRVQGLERGDKLLEARSASPGSLPYALTNATSKAPSAACSSVKEEISPCLCLPTGLGIEDDLTTKSINKLCEVGNGLENAENEISDAYLEEVQLAFAQSRLIDDKSSRVSAWQESGQLASDGKLIRAKTLPSWPPRGQDIGNIFSPTYRQLPAPAPSYTGNHFQPAIRQGSLEPHFGKNLVLGSGKSSDAWAPHGLTEGQNSTHHSPRRRSVSGLFNGTAWSTDLSGQDMSTLATRDLNIPSYSREFSNEANDFSIMDGSLWRQYPDYTLDSKSALDTLPNRRGAFLKGQSDYVVSLPLYRFKTRFSSIRFLVAMTSSRLLFFNKSLNPLPLIKDKT